MQFRIKYLFQINKQILLLCLVLFSLLPCSVKSVVVGYVNLDYDKPLNKAKTTSSVNLCQYVTSELNYTIEKKVKKKYIFFTNSFQKSNIIFSYLNPNFNNKDSLENNLPKYILYKRLKIAVVFIPENRSFFTV